MGVIATRFLRLTVPPMAGPDVAILQTRLRERGFYGGPVDGRFEGGTEAAVRAFQQAENLPVTGVVDVSTWMTLGLGALPDPLSPSTAFITIDTTRRALTLSRGGRVERSYPIAVGRAETPTPLGDWIVIQKQADPGGPFGARWMRLSIPWGGYGIHGTDNPASIGVAASHGCVRLTNEAVVDLYDLVELGTPVKITGAIFTGRLLALGVEGGSDVLEVQRRLQLLGYYRGDLDGFYGPVTAEAVRAFQQDTGLMPDAIVGPRTYERLEAAHDIAVDWTMP